MSAAAAKAPATFGEAKKKRALESHQAMAKALKEHRFEDALAHARTALVLDPNNEVIKQFVHLLEEKAELDATDDESDGEGTPSATAAAGAVAAASDEDSDEEDEEEDEGEEGETSEESEEESEEEDAAVLKALSELRMGEQSDPDAPRKPLLSVAKRKAMHAALGKSIKDILAAELAKKMIDSDPLLGA